MGSVSLQDRLTHIIKALKLIENFVSEVNEKEFLEDIKLQSAVQYQFLIVGEAVRYLDFHIIEKYPFYWHIPRSFRNFIIHEYHGVKMERIYYASKDLKSLKDKVIEILEKEF